MCFFLEQWCSELICVYWPEASGPLTSLCSRSPGSCSSWSLGPSWTPAPAGDSARALQEHPQTYSEIESRAVKQQSQKASHGQRWAWPGSRPGRQLRANRRQCTRSHQRRWSGGPRPGWGPRCYWPGCPLSPHGSPCRRSMPAPRRPSLSDTWTCKQAVPLSVLKWRSWMINLHLLSSCYRMFSFLIRLLSAKPQWWKSWRHRLVSGYLSLQNSLWNFVKSPQMSATQTCWVIKMRGHVSTGTNLSDIR